ncbi:GntR family transcriptional regulator [Enterococcus rotai]|uniref:GntR family transcriptional regulator n=1 Tax=Enterococcus rotai TaxID=118060 RepID=UPI0032B42AE5
MEKLESNALAPLYKQLYESILTKVKNEEYKVGDKIPSEEQLMGIYGVSRVTVRNAIKQLVDENILVKRHGKGTFVSMPAYVESMMAGGSFTESGLQMQKKPGTKVVSIEEKPASGHVAKALGIEKGMPIIAIERIRSLDDIPAIFEIDYFRHDLDFMLELNLTDESLLDVLRTHGGLIAAYFDNIIEISLADEKIAAGLVIEEEEPLVKIHQTVIDNDNQILYFNEQYIRSEMYKVAIRSYNK